ncbi:glycosyltransferase [Lacisediminihabitans changchengi]|uniref:D-inositol 3-phosphate glycosyltransferase n=1 Tax=Lacisediminihabitans changchengi TaxID=2787634 RepID=A0A934VXZ5_9MICO|nr:glycosyltransferase [Lacisediminihabitans changchengi]MBK4347462.1 glycosyltransferase [Lacisediminihabitans changchengi]
MSASGPLRVAMVSMHTSPTAVAGRGDAGGMNVATLSTAMELARRGATVDLLTRAVGPAQSRTIAPGVTLHEVEAGPIGPLPKDRLAEVVDEFGEAVAVLTGRSAARYDIIHAHYWLSGLAVLPVALELGIPLVESFHTVAALTNATLRAGQPGQPVEPVEPERRVMTEMFLAHQASAIVAGSAAEATALIDLARAPADKIWVVPPGVDLELFRPGLPPDDSGSRFRDALHIAPARPILAVVGRIQPLKDQELAIRALALLPDERPVLVIAGEPTPGEEKYRDRLSALADELGIGDDVRFVGALGRGEVAELFAAASLTVIPSRVETFGLVALESAASGTPVVAFHGSGLVESVADGTSGVLVRSREAEDWARVIARLLNDRHALAELSLTARHHAEAFSWAATATSLLGVYASLRR